MDGNTSVIVPPIASPASTVKPNVMVDGCPMIAVPNTSALEVSAASAAVRKVPSGPRFRGKGSPVSKTVP